MPTIKYQKKVDFNKWVATAKIQLTDFGEYDKKTPQNELRSCIHKLAKTNKIFKESFNWWKNSIEDSDLHEAERLGKQIVALHTKLELEYNSV
jgi:hypothetical protein